MKNSIDIYYQQFLYNNIFTLKAMVCPNMPFNVSEKKKHQQHSIKKNHENYLKIK